MTRAIANLVDNAVKWSGEAKAVEVAVREGVVTVRDHGPGIDPADLPRIFDRFYRAPAARTLPGSGLGLAIVRQVAEAYGGTASAGPANGGGALFTLSLPSLDETAEEKETGIQPRRAGAVPSQSRKQRVRSWST